MPTITDVCKLAGVSKATVSRVINGTGQVKESTRKVVFDAMETLQYRPNSLAQALANNKSNSIGLILSTFDGNYFGSLLREATNVAHDAGMQLIVTDGRNDTKLEIEAVNSLVDRRCDVIILYSRSLSEQDFADLKARISVPIVVINRCLKDQYSNAVCFDQQFATQLAMNHLLQKGHRDIACISLSLQSQTGQLRQQAYQQTLIEAGIEINPALLVEGDSQLGTGYQCCQKLIESGSPFSAIFACNDDMAIGAIKALHDAGIKVPEQCAVIGIDNEPLGQYIEPQLSSVELPIKAITHAAMQMALALAKGEATSTGTQEFRGKLVVRAST
ncbi:LacI family transcriptional regulator [Psychromonas marina]|uniref:LacI family transcriptional regulator n=1 Tax=Psychromonas marina TaxID=88364 RepID=A0ABQ6E0D1_9GAMM|nr:LacI family DNA-binding transcriptional regulator [Psychromonas marina]GLS90805.1 LacI family transcriptional regulator [Psychromonas marina]